MEIKKKVTREVEIHQGYVCDLCGVHMDKEYATMFACSVIKSNGVSTLNIDHEKASWDLNEEEVMEQAHFCQKCYIKITNYILMNGGKINEV